jgi:hypothetical protein
MRMPGGGSNLAQQIIGNSATDADEEPASDGSAQQVTKGMNENHETVLGVVVYQAKKGVGHKEKNVVTHLSNSNQTATLSRSSVCIKH